MSKTKEEFVKEVVNISEKMRNAKNEFATALYKYEKDVSALTNVAQSLLWEAENCDELTHTILTRIAKVHTELRCLEGRFNGLKCELT